MSNTKIKALAILLCIATLLGTLISCTDNNKAKEENKTVIIENGVTEYALVRADKLDKQTLDLIIKFRNEIVEKSGCNIMFMTDWVKSKDDIDENAKEILIGNTNREQTKEVMDTLEPNSWAVVETGNKLVICANNDALLSVALDWFIENCVNEKYKTVAVAEKIVKKEGYGNDLPISIGGVSSYQIVYPKGNEQLEYFASLIQRRTSINNNKIAAVDDSTPKSTYEIVIGNTSRSNSQNFTKSYEYSISTSGTSVFINASDDQTLYFAVNYYIEQAISIGETVVSASSDFNKDGTLVKYFNNKWKLGIPYIEEGKIAPVYNTGTGMASDLDKETIIDSYMHLVTNAEYSAFENYAKKLESFGFNKIYSSKTDQNDLWCYRLGGAYAYIHYCPRQKYIRVIWDKSSNCEVSDVDSPIEQSGVTTFYQYSFDYVNSELNFSGSGANCGMLYIIKLQDNSLIMVDGAGMIEKSMKGLTDFLYEITETPSKEALKIRMWYFTHPDGDHNGLLPKWIDYVKLHGHKAPNIDFIGFNYPSERANSTVTKTSTSYTMIDYMNKNYPNTKYLKLHTGMVFNIAEVKVEVLGTVENIVNNKGVIADEYDTNDTCTLLRFSFGTKSVLMTGDIGNHVGVEMSHVNLYTKTFLKSDVLQASHHGYNLITNINSQCRPEYVLIPNSFGYLRTRPEKYNYYAKLADTDKTHYAGNYTTAVAVSNGKITVTKVPRYDNPTGTLSPTIR